MVSSARNCLGKRVGSEREDRRNEDFSFKTKIKPSRKTEEEGELALPFRIESIRFRQFGEYRIDSCFRQKLLQLS